MNFSEIEEGERYPKLGQFKPVGEELNAGLDGCLAAVDGQVVLEAGVIHEPEPTVIISCERILPLIGEFRLLSVVRLLPGSDHLGKLEQIVQEFPEGHG